MNTINLTTFEELKQISGDEFINELIQAFLEETISFSKLPKVIEKTMRQHTTLHHPKLDDILQADQWARETAKSIINDES